MGKGIVLYWMQLVEFLAIFRHLSSFIAILGVLTPQPPYVLYPGDSRRLHALELNFKPHRRKCGRSLKDSDQTGLEAYLLPECCWINKGEYMCSFRFIYLPVFLTTYQSINQSMNQSINQSMNQSINESINQSINESINQ